MSSQNQSVRPDPASQRQAYEAWYFQLSDEQKLAEWQKYYSSSGDYQSRQYQSAEVQQQDTVGHPEIQSQVQLDQSHDSDRQALTVKTRKRRLHPATIALLLAFSVIVLSSSQAVKAQVEQYLQPANQNQAERQLIIPPDPTIGVSEENRIIIPKINVDVPIVFDIQSFDEQEIQEGLDRGVVHYGTTGLPGEVRNNVIVGHSSNNFLNDGEFKFAFVLLEQLEDGDAFIIHYNGVRYVYEIFNRQTIEPDDFSLVQDTGEAISTLITCTPPGTAWKRFVVQARQVSPTIGQEALASAQQAPVQEQIQIPGNGQSFWSDIYDWLF